MDPTTDAGAPALAHRLLPMPEVAATLGIGSTAAWDLVYSGRLPSVKLGRRRLVDSRDLAAFMDGLRAEAS